MPGKFCDDERVKCVGGGETRGKINTFCSQLCLVRPFVGAERRGRGGIGGVCRGGKIVIGQK